MIVRTKEMIRHHIAEIVRQKILLNYPANIILGGHVASMKNAATNITIMDVANVMRITDLI
jgi:hypothetical protein